MIIYNENDKTLIIPNGLGNLNNTESRGYEEGYEAGIEAGKEAQKARLTSTTISNNGTYTREDGFNEVTVNVPSAESELLDFYLCVKGITLNYFDQKRYKYMSSYCVPSMQYSVTAVEGDDIFIFEQNGDRTHLTDSGSFLSDKECIVWVLSDNEIWQGKGYLSGTVANFYSGHIGNVTPKFQRINLYFTPSSDLLINGVNEEVRFYQKDKPHISFIGNISKTKFFFPIGTPLDELRAQFSGIQIIEY